MLMCWLICVAAHAQSDPVLRVSGSESNVLMVPFAQLLEDKSASFDLAEVRGISQGWQPRSGTTFIFGFTKSAWWARWTIANAAPHDVDLVIDLGSPREDYTTWHVLRDSGSTVETTASGDRMAFGRRPLPTQNLTLPLALRAGERVDLYLRMGNYDGMFEPMPITLSSDRHFLASWSRENLLFSLFHGGLLALALYNLLLFVATRDRNFAWYVVYLGSFLTWSFTFRGYAFQHIWPDAVEFNNNLPNVGVNFTIACGILFATSYLRVRENAPVWLVRALYATAGVNVLAAIPSVFGLYALGAGLGMALAVPSMVLMLSTGIWLLFKGVRQARFFVVAFMLLALGAGSYILQVAKVIPVSMFSTWGIPIGSSFEVLLLALGLADSMNTLKLQKLVAERRAREAQEAMTKQLEEQVNERTEELRKTHERLQELSITDALTGAFNRRHFNDACEAAIQVKRRSDPLAFCMFDIDHFKSFNDRYGHQAGDSALQAVAEAVRSELKRSGDVLFRLGGEEFGVLFTAQTQEIAREFVERLRQAIATLEIPHEGSVSGRLTASFGVALWDGDAAVTADRIYATADSVLYAAKSGGRDRLELRTL